VLQPVSGQVRIAADVHGGQQGAKFFLGDPGGQDLRARVLVTDVLPYLLESLVRQTFPRGE
jgi:hypothetical protein